MPNTISSWFTSQQDTAYFIKEASAINSAFVENVWFIDNRRIFRWLDEPLHTPMTLTLFKICFGNHQTVNHSDAVWHCFEGVMGRIPSCWLLLDMLKKECDWKVGYQKLLRERGTKIRMISENLGWDCLSVSEFYLYTKLLRLMFCTQRSKASELLR
jgi:hypothetical protein